MYLRYHAGRSFRHVGGAIAEGALIVAIGAALVFGYAVTTGGNPTGADQALAAKGGKPAAASAGPYIELNGGSDLRLGGKITFSSGAAGLGGGEYPLVYIACWSDADGSRVYGQLDHPDTTFVLGGGSSKWWDVGGGADCKAWLYAYGGKEKGTDTIRTLAGPIGFHAAG